MTTEQNDKFIRSLKKGDALRFISKEELSFDIAYWSNDMKHLFGKLFTFKDIRRYKGTLSILTEEGIEKDSKCANTDGLGWCIFADMVRLYKMNEDAV